jgi:CHAT domain-containing protein/tetratricopeptide (TPR) repeat protein
VTRPIDRHLDGDELNALAEVQTRDARVAEPSSDIREAASHIASCSACNRKVQMHRAVQSELLRRRPAILESGQDCLEESEWVQVVAGLFSQSKTKEHMKHAAQCDHCGPLLRDATATLANDITPGEEQLMASLGSASPEWQKRMADTLRTAVKNPPVREDRAKWVFLQWPRFAFVAAAFVIVLAVGWEGSRLMRPTSIEQLLAQAYGEHRTIEVRIPGAKYAPLRVERGPSRSNLDKPASLLTAEALISENLQKNPNDPRWLQARARADLLDGNYDSAIKTLQRALEAEPDSPQLFADLGSAYYVRAKSADRSVDFGNAIEFLGKALAKTPDEPVALFNHALACEDMFLYTQALDDWEHYLRIDPQGKWSDEARTRLAALQEKLKQHDKNQAEPTLAPAEIAKAAESDPAVQNKIDERFEDYLNLAVMDWLPRAYPEGPHDAREVEDIRSALRRLAEISIQKHGDFWLSQLLESSSSPEFPLAAEQLAQAHRANEIGDNALGQKHAREAERLFALARNEAGALWARQEYVFASHDSQEGKQCIEATNGQERKFTERPYRWLRIQFHLEQGTCYWLNGNLGEARKIYAQAAKESSLAGYGAIHLRADDHLSSASAAVGLLQDGWDRTRRALALFWSGRYPAMRGYNLYYNVYEFARIARQPHLEAEAWRDGIALSETFNDNVLRAMAHSLMASAAIGIKQEDVAELELARASELFARSPQIRSTRIARIEAETRLAEVETNAGKPQVAVERLRQFVPEIAMLSDKFLEILYDTSLAEAESMIGNDQEAEATLDSAIAVSEVQLQSLRDDRSRIEWTQRTANTYRNLAELRLRQGDAQGALEIWEWYRGAVLRAGRNFTTTGATTNSDPFTSHQVGATLPSLTTQTFVSYALMPRGLAVWVYDDRGVFGNWTETNPADIEGRANHFRDLCSDPASDAASIDRSSRALYELLVTPIESHLSSNRTLVIELDDGLSGLPFDALLDSQNRYLADKYSLASSLGIFYRSDARETGLIDTEMPALVAAVPSSSVASDSSVPPLPDAVSEGEMVVRDFREARLLVGNEASAANVLSELPSAVVFHFAGHAVSSPEQSGLMLSDALLNPESLGKVSLSRMRLAVFSACDTQDGSASGVTSADSLVRAFLRAGTSQVIASRWNVDSGVTREFMVLFYRALLGGNTVVQSIHAAQLGLRSRMGMGHPYYWSAFTAFGAV